MEYSYDLAAAYIAAIGGDVMDFRAIHDVEKDIPAIPIRGTLANCWSSLIHYNNLGYGIFATPAMMDGVGHKLANVQHIRAHYVDLDNLSAMQNYERAVASQPAPSFAVNSSPNKMHVYWPVAPYQGNDRFQLVQRKLRQLYDGDKMVIDATRVMRLPGTFHQKQPDAPHLVTCHSLGGYGTMLHVEQLEASLATVNVIDGGSGKRVDLGDPQLAAPSLDWIKYGLTLLDPNALDRIEWIAITSAIKQSGWSLTDPDSLYAIWSEWCARYEHNNVGENLKQWNSIRDTELGWQSLLRRIPSLNAAITLGGVSRERVATATPVTVTPMPTPPPLDCSGEYLTHIEQAEWFKGCVGIERTGEIMTPTGRYMRAAQFNMRYGGKWFIVDGNGKKVNEPWQAATRSTLWTIPKADHTRFLPGLPFGEIVTDQLGRRGVNTYIPIQIKHRAGDVSPFLRHLELMLPIESDRKIILDYLAHNIKFPGYKIRWAPMIQSTEGVGKGFIMETLERILGEMYCYSPKAQELVKSGSTFNAWMRAKLLIIVNEIKVDERRELVEILKPMITDRRVEVQSKGIDQEMEDNCANWLFFSNFKDAIPVNVNGRRYAIFYSAIQSKADLVKRGMGDLYFIELHNWLYDGGDAIVAEYLLNYPIERGHIPQTAPDTSSSVEARELSRSPIERVLVEAIEDGQTGFRGGWVSSITALARIKAQGVTSRSVSPQVVGTVLEGMGYVCCGRANRAYFQEGDHISRGTLYHLGEISDVAGYGRAQGYE